MATRSGSTRPVLKANYIRFFSQEMFEFAATSNAPNYSGAVRADRGSEVLLLVSVGSTVIQCTGRLPF